MTKLITDEQRAQLLTNGRQSIENPDFDPRPVVKLFTPDAGATWLGPLDTPPEQVGLFQGLRIVAQVLVPGVIGPAIGAAVLKDAELVVNGDGTTSFLPNANIWLAAFAAGVVLCGLLALLFARLKKDAPAQETA